MPCPGPIKQTEPFVNGGTTQISILPLNLDQIVLLKLIDRGCDESTPLAFQWKFVHGPT